MSDPFTLDFAALRCFRMVHALGSFSLAAESLGLSQSSVSYTIARLRDVFEDPLFVRQGGGIVPTDRCVEIVSRRVGCWTSSRPWPRRASSIRARRS